MSGPNNSFYRDEYGATNADAVKMMVGRTFSEILCGNVGDDWMQFVADDGWRITFQHDQGCCETVQIEEVVGDLLDLVESPMVLAEQVSSEDAPRPEKEYVDSYTWTFYKFATIKGAVTIRWLGMSNGYYSEEVHIIVEDPRSQSQERKAR